MSIEIIGTVTAMEPLRQGVSQRTGNAWKSQVCVVTEQNEQYPQSLAFTLFNDKIDQYALKIGETVHVYASARVREWQGRHYNDISATNIVREGQPQQQPQPAPQQPSAPPAPPAPQPKEEDGDDLPF